MIKSIPVHLLFVTIIPFYHDRVQLEGNLDVKQNTLTGSFQPISVVCVFIALHRIQYNVIDDIQTLQLKGSHTYIILLTKKIPYSFYIVNK